MHAAGKMFVKTYLKAIRNTFFLISGISQYVMFLFNTKGKFKLLDLQGDPSPSPVPLFSGISCSLHEENPESGWSAYCDDFISKQKIYSM